ncbi:MAG: flagellar hook-associated protein FlgK [Rickettsiales bacterium]
MSISSAINASLTGLQTVEKQITVSSGNIANAKTPGYARQRAELGTQVIAGEVAGVQLIGVTAEINQNVVSEIRNQSGDLAEKNTVAEYFSRIENLYGNLDGSPTLGDRLNDFFTGLQDLSNDPELLSLRQNAVSGAQNAADYVSNLATDLYGLQYTVDGDIGTAVGNVNAILGNLHDINNRISGFLPGSSGFVNLESQQRNLLQQLSEYIPVSVGTASNGTVSVAGPEGTSLLDSRLYRLDYTPSLSPDSIIAGQNFGAITLTALDEKGNAQGVPVDLVTAGTGDEVVYGGEKGKLKGLLELRDQTFPELIGQLDSLAYSFKEAANKEHNDGVAFPPPQTLEGTRGITPDSLLGFDGKVRIAVLKADGSPASSPFPDEDSFTPLTLDLSTLENGNGDGKFDVETLVNEINSYYGAPQSRASVGNLRNVGLVLKDSAIADGGSAQFTLEYDNVSAQNAKVEIVGVQVQDPTDGSTGYGAVTVPSGSFTAAKGERTQGDQGFTLNFSGDDNRSSYTVNVTVRVTDENGNVSQSVIAYNVADDVASGGYNTRYAAQSQSVTSGTGQLYPATGAELLRASYVDAKGGTVQPGEQGYLKLEAANGLRVGIDEMDSSHVSTGGATIDATKKGFSAFFGLNDLFQTGNPDKIQGTAVSLKVRDDIAKNPNYLAIGKLTPSAQPSDPTKASYAYEVGAGDNGNARALAGVGGKTLTFAATNSLPQSSVTLGVYGASTVSFMATKAEKAKTDQEVEQFTFEGLQNMFQETSGVDVDAELAKITELESQYSASATLISTLRSMMDTLIGAFR